MKNFKNISVGFFISFIGSIPLGTLNLIGYKIFSENNFIQLVQFLLGAILIEGIIIYLTLTIASKLKLNPKWERLCSIFSILFLLALAFFFYTASKTGNIETLNTTIFQNFPVFIVGVILSCMNYAQIPFWLTWNLILVNKGYIDTTQNHKYSYIIGAILGAFLGMFTFIFSISKATKSGVISTELVDKTIPIIFIGLALYQVYELFKKRNIK